MDTRRLAGSLMWRQIIDATETPAPNNEDWGSVADAPGTTEDWDLITNAVTDSADWGAL